MFRGRFQGVCGGGRIGRLGKEDARGHIRQPREVTRELGKQPLVSASGTDDHQPRVRATCEPPSGEEVLRADNVARLAPELLNEGSSHGIHPFDDHDGAKRHSITLNTGPEIGELDY